MENNKQSPLALTAKLSGEIHREAQKRDYIINDAIMVEELSSFEKSYLASWLSDSEFYDTFKGNMVGYYLGIAVNAIGGGLEYADAWADGGNKISKIKYDDIYDGGAWNSIFVLLEMNDAEERKDFQNFVIEMYEKWVVLLKDYFKSDMANEYILNTMCAFFQLGITLRLDILGY